MIDCIVLYIQDATSFFSKANDFRVPINKTLCRVTEPDITGEYTVYVMPSGVQLETLTQNKEMCQACFIRLAMMAANGLEFARSDLVKLFGVIRESEGPPTDQ